MGFGIRRCACLGALCALFAAADVRAQPTPLSLEIERQAPSWLRGCLSEASLSERYQVAREPGASTAPLAVQVRVVSQSGGRDATLEIRAANAERSLGARALPVSSRDCAAIPDAVALVLVLLSRAAEAEAAAAPPAPAPAPPAQPPPPIAPPPEAPQSEPQATGSEWRLGPSVLAMFGQLPDPAIGFALEAELLFGVPSVRLRASLLWPQTKQAAEGSVRFSSYELAFDGCLRDDIATSPRLELRICAGLRVGIMHAASSGFELENYRPIDPTLYLGTGPELALPLSKSVWLRAGGGAAIAIYRPRYVLQVPSGGTQYVAEPSLFRGELAVSVLLIF